MNRDDKINIAILIFALVFAAVAFPAAIEQERDAEFGARIRTIYIDNGVGFP